jgi:hypothetical protein
MGNPDFGGKRHTQLEESRFAWEGFVEGVMQIVENLKDDTASLEALYILMRRKVKDGGLSPKEIPQFREDVREIWGKRRTK